MITLNLLTPSDRGEDDSGMRHANVVHRFQDRLGDLLIDYYITRV